MLTQYPIRAVEYVRDTENGVDIAPGSYDFTMTGDVGVLYRDEGWVFRGYVGGLANDYIAPPALPGSKVHRRVRAAQGRDRR